MPAKILEMLDPPKSDYVDRRFKGTKEEYFERLATSATLYVGNLSFYTTEEQVYALFSRAGRVDRVIMGLDAKQRTPCGFCFVVYARRADALAAAACLNGTALDERPIRVDIDYGFEEGRQFGRGRSGGQVRDEFRTDYDEARGGFGKQLVRDIASHGLAVARADGGQVALVPLQGGGGGGGGYGGGGGSGARDTPAPKRRRVEGGGGDKGGDKGGGGGEGGGEGGGHEQQQQQHQPEGDVKQEEEEPEQRQRRGDSEDRDDRE